jgi:hypothetical protein
MIGELAWEGKGVHNYNNSGLSSKRIGGNAGKLFKIHKKYFNNEGDGRTGAAGVGIDKKFLEIFEITMTE